MKELNHSHGPGDLLEKDVSKELAVKDERHWVRLTRLCNQRCQFCLDSWNHNGTYVDTQELMDYIRKGREEGRTRLILSGGEPTIHPDFVKLVAYGRQIGFDWVQTVTNGMMFSYPKFARAAVRAGLNEATFSIHGHNARLQDKLTGTPGAFEKGVQGLRNLQALGGVVTNIDVVINKQNYRELREILDFFLGLGVKEFDLLYVIPFGRGFEDYRRQLFFDLDDDAYPYFQRAFEVSKLPGVFVWTNRLPVEYLENYEHLIQDPHKLHYEINGGRHNFEGLARWGVPPDCYGERCDHCFLAKICRDTLMPYQRSMKDASFQKLRIRHDETLDERQRAQLQRQPAERWHFVAGDTRAGLAALGRWVEHSASPARERVIELEDGGLPDPMVPLEPAPGRWVVRTVEALEALLVGDPAGGLAPRLEALAPREYEVVLDRPTTDWLLAHPEPVRAAADRLLLTLRNHEYLSESRAEDPAPEALRALGALARRFRNVPACVTGHEPEGSDRRTLDSGLVDGKGLLNLDAYVHHYVVEEYYSKSRRCGGCALQASCEGVHINYLRNHGYRVCQPIGASDAEVVPDPLRAAQTA